MASIADTSELLRLRGQAGLLRRQLDDALATPQPATNHIAFPGLRLPREAWSDHGTNKPKDTILTMFWALRQGDRSKLEQIVSPMRDSQTVDDLIFPRDDWDRLLAIQVVKAVTTAEKGQEQGNVEVIVEKAPPADVADKDVDVSVERWFLAKVNDQWVIRSRY